MTTPNNTTCSETSSGGQRRVSFKDDDLCNEYKPTATGKTWRCLEDDTPEPDSTEVTWDGDESSSDLFKCDSLCFNNEYDNNSKTETNVSRCLPSTRRNAVLREMALRASYTARKTATEIALTASAKAKKRSSSSSSSSSTSKNRTGNTVMKEVLLVDLLSACFIIILAVKVTSHVIGAFVTLIFGTTSVWNWTVTTITVLDVVVFMGMITMGGVAAYVHSGGQIVEKTRKSRRSKAKVA